MISATRSLHSSRHALLRDQHLTLLTITDLGVALSIGAVVWSVLTPLNAGVWTLSALSAW